MQLSLDQLSVHFGDIRAVDGLNLTLASGTVGCLLGPSGCGKTTALRAIAGFEAPVSGEIFIGERLVAGRRWSLAPEKRRVGMVFQDHALFPHLEVERNVAFGLRGESKPSAARRVAELLEMVGMSGYAHAYPHELSGGQQQRIALVRAMAPRPDLLLLDEPFSSQDADLREQLAREVRQVLTQDNTTALLVTHDQLEAFAIADMIGVMNFGKLHQWSPAYDLYHKPNDWFVGDFIGQGTLLPATRLNAASLATELGTLHGEFEPGPDNERLSLLIRPDDVIHDDAAPAQATIVDRTFRGAEFLYTLALPSGNHILCLAPSHHDHQIGQRIGIRLDVAHLVLFPGGLTNPE